MACYATTTDINVLDAWNLVDSTSFLDSEATSSYVSTTALDSSSFTPGAITLWGLAVKFISRASSSGTFTVVLRTGGADVAGTSVTIDNTSIPALGGWVFFKFASSVTLAAATAYTLRVVGSVSSSAVVYRDSTANNWSRALITTTTAVPTTNDQLIIAGYYTGTGGAGSDVTVTMNQTGVPVQFGTTSLTQSISIAVRGIFNLANAAGTNYTFKHRGIFQVRGGTLNLGTSGSRLDSTSTFVWTADSVATADSGWNFHSGTVNMYGANNRAKWTTLEADVTSGASKQITVASTTGFLAGDTVYLTCTNSAALTQDDYTTIASIDSATTMTLTSLAYNHTGTNDANGDKRARVVNLTRNIMLTGNSISLGGYMENVSLAGATLNFSYAAFWNMGSTAATAGKRGFDIRHGLSGSTVVDYCCFAFGGTTNGIMLNFTPSAAAASMVVTNTTVVRSGSYGVQLATVGATGCSVEDSLIAGSLTQSSVLFSGANFVFRNNEVIGNQSGANNGGIFIQGDNTNGLPITGDVSGNYIAFCNYGVLFQTNTSSRAYVLDDLTIVQCASYAVYLGMNQNYLIKERQVFNNLTVVSGSTNGPIIMFGAAAFDFVNCVFTKGSATWTQLLTISVVTPKLDLVFRNCTISNGSLSGPVDLPVYTMNGSVKFINCTGLTLPLVLSGDLQYMFDDMIVSSQKHNGTDDSHYASIKQGSVSNDTTLFSTGVQSVRLTPNSATVKCGGVMVWRVRVTDGSTISPTVTWRKSDTGSGDSATYNGNQPRLVMKRNDAVGISADTVLATGTNAANGAWETIGGTSASFTDDGEVIICVDCDGTTGWLNIDEIAVGSESNDMTYWNDGLPVPYLSGGGSGGVGARMVNIRGGADQ